MKNEEWTEENQRELETLVGRLTAAEEKKLIYGRWVEAREALELLKGYIKARDRVNT